MNTKVITETVKKTNPLEELFDIESGTTEITISKPVTESEETIIYDKKDDEIDSQLDIVKDMAHFTFESIQDQIEDIEPKYRARMLEVAANYLNIMHDSVKSKAKLKMNKDKLINSRKGGPKTISNTTNNTIISNTTDIIESIRNGNLESINGEFTIKQEENNDE